MHEIQTNVVLTILACCLDSPTFEYIASHGMPADAEVVLSSGRSFCCVFLSQSVQTGLLLDDPIIQEPKRWSDDATRDELTRAGVAVRGDGENDNNMTIRCTIVWAVRHRFVADFFPPN
jgi:hypothetical protein